MPIAVQYFDPSGVFAAVGATYVQQDVNAKDPDNPEGNDSFVTVDAALGYRFPQRRGLVSKEARNITDKRVKFQDDNFRARTDAPIVSRFIPEQTVVARVTLSF